MKKTVDTDPGAVEILLIDDGELDRVAALLESEGRSFTRLRGGQIPEAVSPPRELLIVTPRRLERVRRGSPPDAAPGRPLRVVATEEDSPAMRRRLRRSGLNLLVRLPADAEIWRLLLARALYKGSERREESRVTVGSSIDLDAASKTLLMDLSNRGCRIKISGEGQSASSFHEGDPIRFRLPGDEVGTGGEEALTLSGEVRRIAHVHGADECTMAIVFDAEMPEETRVRLTALINRWATGPASANLPTQSLSPSIPACQIPAIPDLMLDDETDPPVSADSEISIDLQTPAAKQDSATDSERRDHLRGRFESTVPAQTRSGPVVLIGRDLSAGGMRIEANESLRLGDRFRVAIHGPGQVDSFIVAAEIVRDDGDEGFALAFDTLAPEIATELEKLVACLPDVESLDAGEAGGMGAILSEILVDDDE